MITKMFSNIGGKIKLLAKICTCIGMVGWALLAISTWIMMIVANGALGFFLGLILGAIVFALGVLISWLSSLTLYAVGQLVDNTDRLVVLQGGNPEGTGAADAVKKDNARTAATAEKIARLNRLKDNDLITEEEYRAQMAAIGE